ncbi:MATE family efflux transporter [Actinomyces bowdenii]|uniref:MATE family efflux transporter n=1 Tax=Actinomyces bowdenii TaxID=131109 RepID=UPI00214BBC44|nr:MATE family efflux transporter [Actinomyces bowdenii]MCR2053140.1 MATE family efflux transporter [Actinomyces bowdenii]
MSERIDSKDPATGFHATTLLRYALPSMIASLGGIVIGLTDSIIIAGYSTQALAGVALGAAIYELPINILLGGLMGYRILAPRLGIGGESSREVVGLKLVFRVLFPFSAVLTGSLWFVSLLLIERGHSSVLADTGPYLATRAPSLIAEFICSLLTTTLVLWGRTRTPMTVMLLSGPTNLILDMLLINGIGPVPEMGALGAGAASSLSVTLPIPYLVHIIHRERNRLEKMGEAQENYRGWFRMSLPPMGSAIVDYGGNLVFTVILTSAGTAGLAGMRIGAQLHIVIFIVISSFSSAFLYTLGKSYSTAPNTLFPLIGRMRFIFVAIGCIVGGAIAAMAITASRWTYTDPAVAESFSKAALIIAVLCPIAAAAYSEITALRIFGLTGKEFLGNAIGVWAGQIPIAFALALIAPGTHAPFAALVTYWLMRWWISRRQVRHHALSHGEGIS